MSVFLGKTYDSRSLLHVTAGTYDLATLQASPTHDSIFHSSLKSLIVTDSVVLTAVNSTSRIIKTPFGFDIPSDILIKMQTHVYNITFEYTYQLAATVTPYPISEAFSAIASTDPMVQRVCTLGNQSSTVKKSSKILLSGGILYTFCDSFTNNVQPDESVCFNTPRRFLLANSNWNNLYYIHRTGMSMEFYDVPYVIPPTLTCTIDIFNITVDANFEFFSGETSIRLSDSEFLVNDIDMLSTNICVPVAGISTTPVVYATDLNMSYSSILGAYTAYSIPIPTIASVLADVQEVVYVSTGKFLGGGKNRALVIGGNGYAVSFVNKNTGVTGYYNSADLTVWVEELSMFLTDVALQTMHMGVVEILNTENLPTISVGTELHNSCISKYTSAGVSYFTNPSISHTSMLVTCPYVISVTVPTYTTESPVVLNYDSAVWNYTTLITSIIIPDVPYDTLSTSLLVTAVYDTQGVLVGSNTVTNAANAEHEVFALYVNAVTTSIVVVGTSTGISVYRKTHGSWYRPVDGNVYTVPFNMSGYTIKLLII